jgi:hypothetical protein
MKNIICRMAALALLAGTLSAAPILTLSPANASGSPGTTTGWGFSVTNDTSLYLVISGSTASGFGFGIGSLTDYLGLNFYVFNPNSSRTVDFDAATTQGIGGYAINAGAIPPASDSGIFSIVYDLYVNDPNDPSFAPDLSDVLGLTFGPVTAQVTVSTTDIPEPATLGMAGLAIALGLTWRRYSR